jgi:hypothetical protein
MPQPVRYILPTVHGTSMEPAHETHLLGAFAALLATSSICKSMAVQWAMSVRGRGRSLAHQGERGTLSRVLPCTGCYAANPRELRCPSIHNVPGEGKIRELASIDMEMNGWTDPKKTHAPISPPSTMMHTEGSLDAGSKLSVPEPQADWANGDRL